MRWTIFIHTLRRGWRTMFFWGVGLGALAFFNVIAVPDVNGIKAVAEALAKLPPFVVQLVGGGDISFLGSPAGFLNNQYYAILLMLFGVYAIIAGLNITANEEDTGSMDLLLSTPVPRWRVVLEKYLAYGLLVVGIIIISTLILLLSIQLTPTFNIPFVTLFEVSASILPSTLTVLAFTAFVSTLVRGRSRIAAIAAVFLIASWFVDVLGRTASTSFVNSLRVISVYAYYDTASVFQHGLSAVNIVVPLIAAAALVIGAVWAFQRRNIAV